MIMMMMIKITVLKYAKMKSLFLPSISELPQCLVTYTGINLEFVKTY
jgi:hypothetical protein